MKQNLIQENTQTLMLVSQNDLRQFVQSAVKELLDEREKKDEIYLTAEETCKRLEVNRSTLWRWDNCGYLVAHKVGKKVRYKLSDVEQIIHGER